MLVGHEDILLPTTMVGNYPNPRWYDGYSYSRLPPGALIYDSLTREAFEDAVLAVVHDQEAAGLDIISDGRVHGGDSPCAQVVYHYFERLRGYEIDGPQLGLPIYSTLFSPTVVGPVSRRTSFASPTLRAVRKATNKPVKISYQGIHVLAAASNDQYYKDMRELAIALAKAYREDFLQLADVGVEIIQLDEFLWPYEMSDWQVEVFNEAVDDVPGVQFWVNYEVGRTGPDDLKPLADYGWDKDFVAGVIDVKSTITETADEVAERIRQCLEYVPAERLGLTTDCGLVMLQRMTAQSKLRALAEGAAIVRAELDRPS